MLSGITPSGPVATPSVLELLPQPLAEFPRLRGWGVRPQLHPHRPRARDDSAARRPQPARARLPVVRAQAWGSAPSIRVLRRPQRRLVSRLATQRLLRGQIRHQDLDWGRPRLRGTTSPGRGPEYFGSHAEQDVLLASGGDAAHQQRRLNALQRAGFSAAVRQGTLCRRAARDGGRRDGGCRQGRRRAGCDRLRASAMRHLRAGCSQAGLPGVYDEHGSNVCIDARVGDGEATAASFARASISRASGPGCRASPALR